MVKKKVETVSVPVEVEAKAGKLRSSLNYPVVMKYKGERIMLSAHETVQNVMRSDLEFPLPMGVVFVD